MRSAALVLLSLLALSARAQTPACQPPASGALPYNAVNWTFTLPTLNEDGSAVTPPVTVTLWEVGPTGLTRLCQAQPGATAASWSGLAAGTHAWGATAVTGSSESVMSGLTAKTIVQPEMILVDPAHPDAYSALKVSDGFILARVGTVALGTVCDKTQSVTSGGITYYVVPKSFVTPANPNATALVARCL